MKKVSKKVLSILLIAVLLAEWAPISSLKTQATAYNAEEDTAAYYELDGVESDLEQDDLVWLDASDTTNPLTLHGLLPQEGAPFARMDLTVAETIAGSKGFSATSVYSHARESAGGRIRFTTTSPYLAIKAEFPMYVSSYATGMKAGKYGFDVYVENEESGVYEYYDTLTPSNVPTRDEAWGYEDVLQFKDETAKNIMIYFPITNELSEVYVGLKDSSYIVDSVSQYEDKDPIVYYGSSITQGGMSTKPGNTYVNTIGRKLNYDYIDLGVWGSCRAQTEFANYIAGLDMSAFVFDYDHNEDNADDLARKHHAFYQIVRAAHPDIPIIFVTRPNKAVPGLSEATKVVIKASYDQAVAAGDTKVYYIDGESFFGYSTDYLYDGVHPTDEGQAKMAKVIGDKLVELLPVGKAVMSETVVLEDSFDAGTEWNANGRNWRLENNDHYVYAGSRTNVAELGYEIHHNRALYNSSQMTDVHVEATVNVKEAVCHNGNTQYHMLIARAGADGASGGIGFGFKTLKDSSTMSLVVCQHRSTTKEPETIYYETETVYSHNQDYRLDLFVVGNKIIAKCDGKVIYADEIEGINTRGYCGIVDRRASTGATTPTTKAGRFDDFSLSSISFDSYDVDGAIVCNPNGVGVAEIMQCSGDVSIASIEDCDVMISGYENKASGRYVGPVEVTCDGRTWITGIDQVVYVVEDVADAVTNLTDSRWNLLNSKGYVGGTAWRDNGSGGVVITEGNHYLAVNPVNNKQSEPYSDFYAEYSLAIDKVAGSDDGQALFDLRYLTTETSATTGAIARITYDTGVLRATMLRGDGSYEFTSATLTQGLAVSKEMKVGLLMCDGVLRYFVNNQLVGTMNMGEQEGWLMLKNHKPAMITATVGDFIYVPLDNMVKQIQDCNYSYSKQILQGTALTVSAVPLYDWPYNYSEELEITEGVVISGLDTSTQGVKQFTASYNGMYEKQLEVEVSGPIQGAIVCNQDAVGVADILQFTNGACTILEDQSVTVEGYSNKPCGRYIGSVKVIYGDNTEYQTDDGQVVYVVKDLADAVTNLTDSRWNTLNSSGWSGDTPTWIDSGSGNVIINDSVNNYLRVNPLINDKQSEPYSNFYAEYMLTIDRVAGGSEEEALFDLRYFTAENSQTTDGAIARIAYANGGLTASMVKASGSYDYTTTTLTQGLAVGSKMKIGLLVCEGVVEYFVNEQSVGSMTIGETEGWLILKNNKPAVITATIGEFVYIPLEGIEKTILDCEYSYPSRVLKDTKVEVSALPIYNWPYLEGTATTEGVQVSGLDTSTCGVKKVTATFEEKYEQQLEIEVTNLIYAEYFDGTKDDLTDNGWNSTSCTLEDGKAVLDLGKSALYVTRIASYKKWTDYTVSAEVALIEREGTITTHTAGIVARTTGANDGYEWALYTSNGSTYVRLYDRKTKTTLAIVGYPIDFGEFYTLKLTVKGNVIQGYIGNEKVIETSATSCPEGSIGIRLSGGYDGLYDNVLVTLPEYDSSVVDITKQHIWFTDTFEAESAMTDRGWNIDSMIRKGRMQLGGENSQTLVLLNMITGSDDWTDYTAQVDVTVGEDLEEMATTKTNASALVVRSQNGNTGYEFGVIIESSTGTGVFRLYNRTNGQTLATSDVVLPERGRTYTLTTVVEGSRIRCLVDGALVIDVVDDTNKTGFIGLRTVGYAGKYDNVIIRKVADSDRVGVSDTVMSPGTGDHTVAIIIPVVSMVLTLTVVLYVLWRRTKLTCVDKREV